MKVLLFVTDLEVGGTPTVIRELARRLPSVGIETAVACLGRYGPVAEQIADDGVEVTAFGRAAWQLPLAVRDLRRAAGGVDVVFSFLVHANVTAALAGLTNVQAVQTTQPYPAWHWRAQAWAARRTAAVVCCSPSVAEAAHERSGVPREKLVVIPNAVEHVADSPQVRSRPMRVGFLGRLDPVKRVHLLIDACHLAGVPLDVFGDGPDRPRLEAHAAGKDVTFHGFTPRDDALAAVDVVALTSEAEGMPMVLIEAMAAGVPVVALDAPGVRDVIRDGQTGVLCRDVPGLAAELATARQQPDRRRRFATEALAEVRRSYTWDAVLPRYRDVLTAACRGA